MISNIGGRVMAAVKATSERDERAVLEFLTSCFADGTSIRTS